MTTTTISKPEDTLVHREVSKRNGIANGKIGKDSNGNIEKANGTIKNGTEPSHAPDSYGVLPSDIGTDYTFKRKIVWFNAIGFLVLHLLAAYGVYLALFTAKWLTLGWMVVMAYLGGEGVTMGAHRLYAHKSFKAHFLLRLALVMLHTVAGQNCLYIWVRDHRQHHKFSDTDADPHNAKRGFFFSHIGWLMSKKHPAVISKGKTLDLSDLEADPLVMFQKKYYKSLYLVLAVALPVAVPVYLWDETYLNSFFISYMARYILALNITWLVNSAAHLWGTRPYDRFLQPVECAIVSLLTIGEGWHNYHHAFPWDYRTSEFGRSFNFTAKFIEILAYLGFAYDLRAASDKMIQHRVNKAGDGSYNKLGFISKEIPQEDLDVEYVETLKEFGVFGGISALHPHAVQAAAVKSY